MLEEKSGNKRYVDCATMFINYQKLNNLVAYIASDITDGNVRLPSRNCVDMI